MKPVSGHCVKCGTWRRSLHRDHIKPRALGGSSELSNIQLLCANCHQDKTFEDMKKIHWTLSKATRKRMSKAQKIAQSNRSEEVCRNMGLAQLGKIRSEETRKKISEAIKGKRLSKEHREKFV